MQICSTADAISARVIPLGAFSLCGPFPPSHIFSPLDFRRSLAVSLEVYHGGAFSKSTTRQ
jgi:hypothetical protein